MIATLFDYFRASYPAIAISTVDEARACKDVIAAARKAGKEVISWSATEGLVVVGEKETKQIANTEDLAAACAERRDETVFIMRDPHTWPFERDPVLLRGFRDFIVAAPTQGSSVVILANNYVPHPTIEKLVVVLEHELPTAADLTTIAEEVAKTNEIPGAKVTEDLLRALSGLTAMEAENALALSAVKTRGFSPDVIYEEKTLAVRRTGLLSIVAPDPAGLDAIGGLGALKGWIGRRRSIWSEKAKAYGLANPKGVMIVGVPGTGKSLAARVFGTALGVPTVRLDMGSMFNSLIGESERRIRDALRLAEAVAPCVLWIDEVDKGLAGAGGTGNGDSGVGKKVFGTLLTWMQEHKRPVFVVMTANSVEALPPELLRKGRLDEIFTVDLPTPAEREEIFAIHLAKRKRKVAEFDLAALAKGTPDFTGSEIEAVVEDGMTRSFDADRALATADLLAAAGDTVPLAVTAKEQVERVRAWGETRGKRASATAGMSPVATGRRIAARGA